MTTLFARPAPAAEPPPTEPENRPKPKPLKDMIKPANRPLALAAGMFAASIITTDVPFWAAGPLWGAAAYGVHRLVRAKARRKHAKFPPNTARWCAATGGWMALASAVHWNIWGLPNTILGTALAAAGVVSYVTLHPKARWNAPEEEVLALPAAPVVDEAEELIAAHRAKWDKIATGLLANTRLGEITPLSSHGWRGVIYLEGNASPEVIEGSDVRWRVAREWGYPLSRVVITADPHHAGRATLLMLKNNPIEEAVIWDGTGIQIGGDADGSADIAAYIGGGVDHYRFWTQHGAVPDLIAGVMGTGKSETVNLLMTMEVMARDALGRGLVASYLFDPQQGQSYGELVDAIAGHAYTIEQGRELLGQLYAEMIWRNGVLAKMPWTDPRTGKARVGVKTWTISADMPLIVATLDEAHVWLADPICKVLVEKLLAMGRKCGIKIRVIVQMPVLSSLGNSSEIAELIKAGNIIIHRTASSTTATIAAEGRLGGKPHKLPEHWPYTKADGTEGFRSSAGVCYMAGAFAKAEMARVFWIEDCYPWLYDDDGRLRYAPTTVNLPTTDEATAAAATATAGPGKDNSAEWLRNWFGERPGQLTTRKEVLAAVGDLFSLSTVAHTLSDLRGEGFLDQSKAGEYTHNPK